MYAKRVLFGIVLIIIGLLSIFVGEVDDAPGAGMIGLVIIATGIYIAAKEIYKETRTKIKG